MTPKYDTISVKKRLGVKPKLASFKKLIAKKTGISANNGEAVKIALDVAIEEYKQK